MTGKPHTERRLAAILAADIVGYSRLMGADEEGTLSAVKRVRADIVDPGIATHGGRIVKSTGDGVLIEFPSVIEAVRCAVALQDRLSADNAGRPAQSRLTYRMGINLGDILIDEDDIFGDGVNVAARLEALADPGGIAVSAAVYDQVRGKIDVGFIDRGAQRFKNIAEPVRVYDVGNAGLARSKTAPGSRPAPIRRYLMAAAAVSMLAAAGGAWLLSSPGPGPAPEPASTARMRFPLPEKPSLAVLPFEALGNDPTTAPIADGLTDTLISSLSKISKMFVIARTSTYAYRGRKVKIQQVAEELGVRYVLTGSVQRSGDNLRITAQLVDAVSGFQMWGDRYDRPVGEIFALQDELSLKLMGALQIELTEGEMARVRQRGTSSLEAWMLVSQSIDLFQRLNKEDNARARELAERAIAIDPNYPDAYIRLARAHLTDFQAGWVADRPAAFKRSIELVKRALELDDTYPDTYNILGAIYLYVRRHDEALAFAEKAVSLSPSYAIARASLGMVQNYSGMPEAGIASMQSAMRLSPYYPAWFLKELGRGYILTGQTAAAVDALQRGLERNPKDSETQLLLAAAHGAAGQDEKGRDVLRAFLRSHPNYNLTVYAQGEFYRNPEDLKKIVDALSRVGMPE